MCATLTLARRFPRCTQRIVIVRQRAERRRRCETDVHERGDLERPSELRHAVVWCLRLVPELVQRQQHRQRVKVHEVRVAGSDDPSGQRRAHDMRRRHQLPTSEDLQRLAQLDHHRALRHLDLHQPIVSHSLDPETALVVAVLRCLHGLGVEKHPRRNDRQGIEVRVLFAPQHVRADVLLVQRQVGQRAGDVRPAGEQARQRLLGETETELAGDQRVESHVVRQPTSPLISAPEPRYAQRALIRPDVLGEQRRVVRRVLAPARVTDHAGKPVHLVIPLPGGENRLLGPRRREASLVPQVGSMVLLHAVRRLFVDRGHLRHTRERRGRRHRIGRAVDHGERADRAQRFDDLLGCRPALHIVIPNDRHDILHVSTPRQSIAL